jgi:hypothetical protein
LTTRLFVAKPRKFKPDLPAGLANVLRDYPDVATVRKPGRRDVPPGVAVVGVPARIVGVAPPLTARGWPHGSGHTKTAAPTWERRQCRRQPRYISRLSDTAGDSHHIVGQLFAVGLPTDIYLEPA